MYMYSMETGLILIVSKFGKVRGLQSVCNPLKAKKVLTFLHGNFKNILFTFTEEKKRKYNKPKKRYRKLFFTDGQTWITW